MQINNKKEGESFNHHFQVKTGAMSLLKYRAIGEYHIVLQNTTIRKDYERISK